jgi:hypothetical protein
VWRSSHEVRSSSQHQTSQLSEAQFTRKPQACHNNMKALLKKAMKDQDHQAAMAAAALAAAAPKKHAAAPQAETAAAQVQVTKSALLLSGKFFRPSYIFKIFVASKCFKSWLLVIN